MTNKYATSSPKRKTATPRRGGGSLKKASERRRLISLRLSPQAFALLRLTHRSTGGSRTNIVEKAIVAFCATK